MKIPTKTSVTGILNLNQFANNLDLGTAKGRYSYMQIEGEGAQKTKLGLTSNAGRNNSRTETRKLAGPNIRNYNAGSRIQQT